MPIAKRRGRPAGTDYKEDLEALALIADHLIADKSLKPWPITKEVCKTRKWKGQTDEAVVARWLRKWKSQGPAQFAAARQRCADRETRPVTTVRPHLSNSIIAHELSLKFQRHQAEMAIATEPARKAMEQFAAAMDTPRMRAFYEEQRKIAERFAQSPVFKDMQRLSEQLKNMPPLQLPKNFWRG